jgi:hypothetical protein
MNLYPKRKIHTKSPTIEEPNIVLVTGVFHTSKSIRGTKTLGENPIISNDRGITPHLTTR